MTPVGFKPTSSAGERLQTYALDRKATATGSLHQNIICTSSPVISSHDCITYYYCYLPCHCYSLKNYQLPTFSTLLNIYQTTAEPNGSTSLDRAFSYFHPPPILMVYLPISTLMIANLSSKRFSQQNSMFTPHLHPTQHLVPTTT